MLRSLRLSVIAIMTLVAAVSSGSELGNRLDHELKGAWGVLESEVYSACGGSYSNNEVGAGGVASKAGHHFDPGELVKIDNVKVHRRRVDLMLTLTVPLRISRMDGPFELFDQRTCRVQLMVYVPRELVKNADVAALLTQIQQHLTTFRTTDDAQSSDSWNGRETEPLPADYELTMQRHAVWKAEQTNAAVRAGIDDAISEAAEAAEDLDDDDDYRDGFAMGAEKMSEFTVTNCSSLLSASFTSYRKTTPKDRTTRWQRGWEDGQKLVFHVLLADRLRECLVPVPPSPAP